MSYLTKLRENLPKRWAFHQEIPLKCQHYGNHPSGLLQTVFVRCSLGRDDAADVEEGLLQLAEAH